MSEIVFKQESYDIVGACFEVYNEMGCGFLEAVYQECLSMEFIDRMIPFVAQQKLTIAYKDRPLNATYIPDFVCYNNIIIEIKALRTIGNDHRAQVHNYLKATGYQLGILINFGHTSKLEYERIVR